jgi:hypothetical protein
MKVFGPVPQGSNVTPEQIRIEKLLEESKRDISALLVGLNRVRKKRK